MATGDRVTILGLNYAPEPTGNAPYTAALAHHLSSNGSPVRAITTHPHYPQWRRYEGYGSWRTVSEQDGAQIIRLRHYVPSRPRGLRRLVSEMSFGARLLLSPWGRPDVVVLVSPALFSSWLAMMRLLVQRHPRRIVWVQDLYSQGMAETGEGGGLSVRMARLVEGWTLRRAHRVVAIHTSMATRMTSSLKVDPDKVEVIPNWSHITPSGLSQGEAREELGWPDAFTVLHAGNMGLKQGLDVAVDAARLADARGSELRFVFLGDGGERAYLERRAAGIERIDFQDPVPDDLFPVALAAADVLIVTEAPGVAEMAAPSKLTSYFAAERPVVASVADHGIVASIMARSNAGPCAVPGDAGALLESVESIAAHPSVASQYAASARKYWDSELGAKQALAAWDGVLETATLDADNRGDT